MTDFYEPDEDIEYLKRIFDDQVRRGLTGQTARHHQFTSAHCAHGRHAVCTAGCPYCRASCDCDCHAVEH